jgi:hypothetical protein
VKRSFGKVSFKTRAHIFDLLASQFQIQKVIDHVERISAADGIPSAGSINDVIAFFG